MNYMITVDKLKELWDKYLYTVTGKGVLANASVLRSDYMEFVG